MNRDTANATIDASRMVSTTVGMTMIAEFLKSVAKPAWCANWRERWAI